MECHWTWRSLWYQKVFLSLELRSTIARLPGEKKRFMGENLEIICLFQAAEIERLIDNLDDFRLRYYWAYLDINKLKRKSLIDIRSRSKSKSLLWELTKMNPFKLITKSLENSLKNKQYIFFYCIDWARGLKKESIRHGCEFAIKIS